MLHSHERPLREEVADLARETLRLFQLEMQLARTELSPGMARIGWQLVAMMFGCVITGTGILALVISAIMGLAKVVPPWLTAFSCGVLLICSGTGLFFWGKKRIGRETLVPGKVFESLKEAVQKAKEELTSAEVDRAGKETEKTP